MHDRHHHPISPRDQHAHAVTCGQEAASKARLMNKDDESVTIFDDSRKISKDNARNSSRVFGHVRVRSIPVKFGRNWLWQQNIRRNKHSGTFGGPERQRDPILPLVTPSIGAELSGKLIKITHLVKLSARTPAQAKMFQNNVEMETLFQMVCFGNCAVQNCVITRILGLIDTSEYRAILLLKKCNFTNKSNTSLSQARSRGDLVQWVQDNRAIVGQHRLRTKWETTSLWAKISQLRQR